MELLRNPGFEADWSEEQSHETLRFVGIPTSGTMHREQIGNIFTPPGWVSWFWHEPGIYGQPEIRDAWREVDPRRVRSGEKALLCFTFSRPHLAGLLQQVTVTPGQRLLLGGYAHAWSNHKLEGHEACADDPRCSCGVGRVEWFGLVGTVPDDTGDPWQDAKANFTFSLGIDPLGGLCPLASSVVWGRGAHIYNGYFEVPLVEVVAQNSVVTVFLGSWARWPFKHNDAYWDDITLTEVQRGRPRVQYERTYVLMPPGADAAWAAAVMRARWDSDRWTVGGSADDAGIGDLDARRVIAVNPGAWDGDLQAWFAEWYPGVEFVPVVAETPEALEAALGA